MISRQIVDQVTEASTANIASIVGEYVSLRRKGASYMGCCPFHNEKTPSFSVNPAKGFYYCFGCHKGGNAVNFVMELEKLSFPDAIRHLGKKFGIAVPEEEQSPEEERAGRERDGLYAIMEYAARAYEANLRESEEGQAYGLTYFRHRGFRDDTIATFRLGYALNESNGLHAKALADGYKEDGLIKNGLLRVNPDNGGKYDYFRGRVMFPIQNATGKVIGFGGRVLDARTKGVNVKYLNSPETELYKKTDIVYGIYQARTEISRKNKCYLVEGYTDVISMHQSGIANVVASSGTALTTNQIRLIKRFTENITVLYDGDSAGIHASLRGIDMILREGMNVRVLLLPDGDDPDSFSLKHTADEFQAYVDEHETDFIRYEAETLMADSGNDPLKKAEATHTIVASISEVQDSIKREFYVKECARIMGISEEAVFSELQKQMVRNATEQRDRDIREQRLRQFQEQRRQEEQAATLQPAPAAAQMPPDLPPDLSPSEMAMLQGQGMTAPPRSVPKPAATAMPQEVEMREIMRYLVTYTQAELHVGEGVITVGDYILSMLDADGLTPQSPTLVKILDEYRDAPDRRAIDDKHYLGMADPDVVAFVAQAIGGRPALSKIHSKYSPVEMEKDSLDEFVPRAIKELQIKQVYRMWDETMATLNRLTEEGASDEEIEKVMNDLNDLNKVKRELSLEMGERAIGR